jgi:hypothetical protein
VREDPDILESRYSPEKCASQKSAQLASSTTTIIILASRLGQRIAFLGTAWRSALSRRIAISAIANVGFQLAEIARIDWM